MLDFENSASAKYTPNPIQGFDTQPLGNPISEPATYHTHNGVDSPKLDGIPAGVDGSVQYNDEGKLAGDENFLWDKDEDTLSIQSSNESLILGDLGPRHMIEFQISTSVNHGVSYITATTSTDYGAETGNDLTIAAGDAIAGKGGDLILNAGAPADGGITNGPGGDIALNATSGIGNGSGGGIDLAAGNSDIGAAGGNLDFSAGEGDPGGAITITSGGGDSLRSVEATGDGGDVEVEGGSVGRDGTAGNVYILGGTAGVNFQNQGNAYPGEVVISAGGTTGKGHGASVFISGGNAQGGSEEEPYEAGHVYLNPGSGSSPDRAGSVIIERSYIPDNTADVGEKGSIAYDLNYFYICVATNTWKRVALSTWVESASMSPSASLSPSSSDSRSTSTSRSPSASPSKSRSPSASPSA